MSIERRIAKAEKVIGIKGEPVLVPAIIICVDWSTDDKLPGFPEPVSEWATVARERDVAMQNLLPQVSIANLFAEYEARHGLEPGTLTEHDLRGKVPFAELLAAATGRTRDRGEQSCTD
jgi:hypothetical protein